MKRLWSAFEVVAEHALSVGARVFIEWPRACRYWKDSRVVAFLSKHGFVSAEFDGCMYGLVAEKGPMQGAPINKPWRVACSPNSSLPKFLNKKCDRSHEHTPCAGRNTLGTQGYTDEICKIIHQSISHDIALSCKDGEKQLDHQIALAVIEPPRKEVIESSAVACAPQLACVALSCPPASTMAFAQQMNSEIVEEGDL